MTTQEAAVKIVALIVVGVVGYYGIKMISRTQS